MATQTERIELVEVDINDSNLLEGSVTEVDLKEDWQAKAAPPPKNRYKLKIFAEDDKVEQGVKQGFKKGDPNGVYYRKQLTCKIQDTTGEWQDSIVYYNVSTGIPKGKTLSSAAGMIRDIGVKLALRMNDLATIRLLIRALKQLDGPILIAECDWSAWDKSDTKRSEIGAALKVGMVNFPLKTDGSGKRNHIIYNKIGEEVVAKLKIIKWLGKPTVAPAVNGTAAKVVAPVQQQVVKPKPQVIQEVIPETIEVVTSDSVTFDEDGEVVIDV